MRFVNLATEDELTEAIGLRLIGEWVDRLAVGLRIGRQGNGYLRSRIRKFAEIARRTPTLIITDLDQRSCAPELRRQWLGRLDEPSDLLLRVAVREVESWLLADDVAIRALLGARASRSLPGNPDSIRQPKNYLLRCAWQAPRMIREHICKGTVGTLSQGLGYNALLCQMVAHSWDPARAAERSDSLTRAREQIQRLALREIRPTTYSV